MGGERNPTVLINRSVNRKTEIERQNVAAGAMPSPALASTWPAFLQNLVRFDVLVALALIFVWGAVLAGAALWLPTHAASWLTFLALVIMPGYLLGDLLTTRLDLDQVERLALAFPLGMAVLTLPGLSALLFHWTLDQLALGWAGCTGVVVVVWLVARVTRAWAQVERTPSAPWKVDEIALGALLLGAFLVMLPALTLYKIDGDAYAVNSFAADALAGVPLNQMEPLFGTELGPGVRMAFNQSLPLAYLWSFWSGIDQIELTSVASRAMIALAAILIILGGLAQMYVTIIGGQAFPMPLFPGKEVSSSFFDGVVASYTPSLPEFLLGIGGIGIALGMTVFAIKVLPFLPTSLADADVDPHHKAGAAKAV